MKIVSKDANPKNSVYFLGAQVIESLKSFEGLEIDFFELFREVNKKQRVSMQLYLLTIDWLFILGIVKINTQGELIKCS